VRKNTQEALRKFRLKLLSIIDEKCPVQYSINGDENTITVQFLEEKKRVKATAGGRGSRARRRKRREMQQLQYRQMQEQQLQPENEINRQHQMPDDTNDFSVIISEDGPDAHTEAHPVPTLATALARYNDAPGGHNSSPTFSFPHPGTELGELHQPRLNNIQAGWARTQTNGTVAPDGRNSSPTISFQHPGTELGKLHQLGIHNIPRRWPKQEKMAAKKENSNNEGHLLTLLMDQMKNMQSELNDLKNEQKQMIKTSDKMQSSIKRFREYKEKDVYCWHCRIYTAAVHYCSMEEKWIHLDRFNRIIIYSATEEGANPKHGTDIADGYTLRLPRFAIDNRDEIIRVREEEKRKKEMREQMEAMATRELLLKGDVKKQEEDELERKRKEGQRQEQEMKRQRQDELEQERQEKQRQDENYFKLRMRLNGNYGY
jgi:hypothetical protein